MQDFFEYGYFGSEVDGYRSKLLTDQPETFALARHIKKTAYSSVAGLMVKTHEVHRIFLLSILLRTLSTFEPLQLCAERGMDFECRILLRSMMEAQFLLTACANDEEYAKQILKTSEITRKKSAEKFLASDLSLLTEDQVRELEASLEMAKANSAGLEDQQQWQVAQKAATYDKQLGDERLKEYPFYSESTHVSPRSLGEQLRMDGEGNLQGIEIGPHMQNGLAWLLKGMHKLVAAIAAANQVLQLMSHEEILTLKLSTAKVLEEFGRKHEP